MSSNVNVKGYFDTINQPWGQLFYKLVWHHLEYKDKRILDYGSGFGITADHLAINNDVIAIEPNEEMLKYQHSSNEYSQIIGGLEKLKDIPDNSIDIIVCHNVLEYIDNRQELINEFMRVLNPDGLISIVKHNKVGKIMQKVILENKIDEAINLINNGKVESVNFGLINEYDNSELEIYCEGKLVIDKIFGIRTFYSLQKNELKSDPNWISNMYKVECLVEEKPEFREIAFFHHIILRKNN